MNKNQSGFSVVEMLIIVVMLGLVVAVGWLIYDRQQKQDTPTNTVGSELVELKGDVSYIDTEIPGDWVEVHQQGSSTYSLESAQLECVVSVRVDKPKVDLSNVQPLPGAPSRDVTLGSGQKVTVYEIGQSKLYFESEGHIVEDEFIVSVTVGCKDTVNYPAADLALKGIRLE